MGLIVDKTITICGKEYKAKECVIRNTNTKTGIVEITKVLAFVKDGKLHMSSSTECKECPAFHY